VTCDRSRTSAAPSAEGTYDRDMLKEAGVISTVYAVNIGLLAEKTPRL